MKFHVLMASHNRRQTTVTCLASLQEAASFSEVQLTLTLFDDGSSDGTAAAALEVMPDAYVIAGDGTAYWASGMAQGETAALRHASASDYLLWLNDDVVLDIDSLQRLLEVVTARPGRVVVGSMRDPSTGKVTYAGFRRAGRHPLRFDLVEPEAHPRELDAFNGNFVAIPVTTVRRLGGIDGGFSHAFADIDLGVRLARSGEPALLAPGTHGECARNPPRPRGSLFDDWKYFRSPKGGGNYLALHRFMRRHAPRSAPVFIFYTYAAWWARELKSRFVPGGSDD